MGWFKKKEEKEDENYEELPELPELLPLSTKLDDSNKFRAQLDKKSLPPLPSFPSSSTDEKIDREIVKQSMNQEYDEEEIFPNEPQTQPPPIKRMKEIKTLTKPKAMWEDTSWKKPSWEFEETPRITETKTEPVFVRIDKYKDALINFQEIKKRVLEMESLLREMKEIKEKEEAELQGWEEEIREAKEKLNRIDSTLFKKLD